MAGKLQTSKRETDRLTEAMQHVEAVLKLLQPDYRLQRIVVRRRKPNPFFKRGTLLRHAFDALRTAHQPLTPREIATRLIAGKGVKDATPAQVSRLTGSVLSALQCHKGDSLVAHRNAVPVRWSLAA
ncbi:MAG TPA: hypothetical protein VMV19_04755 [Xanthobacteraceae bacterium]|nr:hypothetical protein [Xanthobacteraceae bacterium]